MASRFAQTRVGKIQQQFESRLLGEGSQGAPLWCQREEHRDQGESLRGQLKEMDEHVARLQDTLKSERAKCNRLQLQNSQQEVELRRREQHCNRLKERLALLTDRTRDKAASIEVLNFPPGCRGKRGPLVRSLQSVAKREEAALRLMLERREAELREAMKLRHSLTTLLHALRVDMERTLSDCEDPQDEAQREDDDRLSKAEEALGDHVTGGVVHSWRRVQGRVGDLLSEGNTGVGTDHDKLLAQLEAELKQSQQIVKLQQQMLQDSLVSPVPSELADSYFLEEWERLQARWAELAHQRQTFERERQLFTDAAIRLSHERRDFEQQKAFILKQQYLGDSLSLGHRAPPNVSAASSEYAGLGSSSISGCLPITPTSTDSGEAATAAPHQARVQTPSTPELYSALSLTYNCRAREGGSRSELWEGGVDGMVPSPHAQRLDWSF